MKNAYVELGVGHALSLKKCESRFGFRDLNKFNMALLGKPGCGVS